MPHGADPLAALPEVQRRVLRESAAAIAERGFLLGRADGHRRRARHAARRGQLNELAGRTFVRSLLEWNLPPIRFRRAGKPAFHLQWARPALFAGVATTDFDDSALRRTTGTAGAQLDFSISTLHALDMVLSFGEAWSFADGRKPASETMVSLKILR